MQRPGPGSTGRAAMTLADRSATASAPRVTWHVDAAGLRCSVEWPGGRPPLSRVLPIFEQLGLDLVDHVPGETGDSFAFSEVEDPNLPKGHRVVVQSGRVGEATTTYAVQTLGGAEVSRTVLTRTVTTEPRDEIIKVGTMDVSVSVDPGSARAIGRSLAAQRGWGDDQFACLDKLWTKESNWRVDADNPNSTAYGIPQALPGSKMASVGADWRTNPHAIAIETRDVASDDSLTLPLAAGGGAAIRFAAGKR